MSAPVLQIQTSAGVVDEITVDAWELKAARRALTNLKTLLHGEPMLALLQEQIDEADRYYTSLIAASDGQFRECRVDITAAGLTATDFLQWFMQSVAMDPRASAIEFMYPAHPEHYVLLPDPAIVEVIGGHPVRLRMDPIFDAAQLPAAVSRLADESFPLKLMMAVMLKDGSHFGYVLHELRDTATGCDIILRAMFPAAAPDHLVAGHSEHFSVEFRNWLRAAAAAVAANATAPDSH
jgi:hypothetical protein